MSPHKHSLILILLIFMSESLYAFEKCQIPSFEDRESKPYGCSLTLKNGQTLEISVFWNMKSSTLSLKRDGKYVELINRKHLSEHIEQLDNIFVDRINDLLVVFYEVGDSEGVLSEAAAFSMHNFKRKWKTDLSGFNLHVVRKGDVAFTSTIGFVAKINLKSGKFLWKHDNLYKTYEFSPDEIVLEKDMVRFLSLQGQKPLLINQKTGKIINQ
jgi:hypothetical protein